MDKPRQTAVQDRVRRAVAFILAVLSVSTAGAQQPDPSQTIRVRTSLVNVPTIISDASGRFLPGLQRSEFRLLDDGKPQEIAFFAATDEPLSVALLLDTSKSTVSVLNKIKKAGSRFLRHLQPRDRALIASFDASVRVLCPLTADRKDLEESIREASVGEYVGTKLRDAVVTITEKRLKPILGRKAIIILTDGQDFGSEATPSNVLSTVTESGTVVYTMLYSVDPRETMKKLFGVSPKVPRRGSGPSRDWQERERNAAAVMEQLSNDSAGRFYRVEMTDLEKTFSQIAEELRHQYLLAFYPERSRVDGKPHSLAVDVARPGAVVRSRSTYQITR